MHYGDQDTGIPLEQIEALKARHPEVGHLHLSGRARLLQQPAAEQLQRSGLHQGVGAHARLLPQAPWIACASIGTISKASGEPSQAAPLSARKAMLVAALVDAYVDRLFAARPRRTTFWSSAPDMAPVTGAGPGHGAVLPAAATLVTEAVAVPIADYGALSSRTSWSASTTTTACSGCGWCAPDGERIDMLETLREAIGGTGLGLAWRRGNRACRRARCRRVEQFLGASGAEDVVLSRCAWARRRNSIAMSPGCGEMKCRPS